MDAQSEQAVVSRTTWFWTFVGMALVGCLFGAIAPELRTFGKANDVFLICYGLGLFYGIPERAHLPFAVSRGARHALIATLALSAGGAAAITGKAPFFGAGMALAVHCPFALMRTFRKRKGVRACLAAITLVWLLAGIILWSAPAAMYGFAMSVIGLLFLTQRLD